MTRHIISREGVVEDFDKTLLEVGSLTWDEGRVPVGWEFKWDGQFLLGYAENLRREENGDITAEITFQERELEVHSGREFLGATVYASSVVQKMSKGVRVISGAKVKGVAITMGVPWRLSEWELETVGKPDLER